MADPNPRATARHPSFSTSFPLPLCAMLLHLVGIMIDSGGELTPAGIAAHSAAILVCVIAAVLAIRSYRHQRRTARTGTPCPQCLHSDRGGRIMSRTGARLQAVSFELIHSKKALRTDLAVVLVIAVLLIISMSLLGEPVQNIVLYVNFLCVSAINFFAGAMELHGKLADDCEACRDAAAELTH